MNPPIFIFSLAAAYNWLVVLLPDLAMYEFEQNDVNSWFCKFADAFFSRYRRFKSWREQYIINNIA